MVGMVGWALAKAWESGPGEPPALVASWSSPRANRLGPKGGAGIISIGLSGSAHFNCTQTVSINVQSHTT